MPAVEHGLGLVERVVRRHVAKLASVGWCERMAAIRGDRSLVWMTAAGLQGLGLGELPALRAPEPFSPLPDLVFWPSLDDRLPVAVLVAQELANSRRERAALQGWQASITAGRYAQVRYLAGPVVASRLRRLATDVGLMPAQFIVGERVVAGEPAALAEVI
jgi:hypothetical protein